MQCPTNLKAKLYRQEKIQKFKYQRSLLLLLSGIGIYIAHVTPISVRSQEFSGEKKTAYSCQSTYLSVNKKVTF